MIKFKNTNKGYIALTSAVIIVMVVMAIITAVSVSTYFSRYNSLGSEFKEISLSLAEGCAEKALLNYAEDEFYAGNESINIGSNQCSILPIEIDGSNRIFKTTAMVQGATSNIKVTFNPIGLAIVSWEELPNF